MSTHTKNMSVSFLTALALVVALQAAPARGQESAPAKASGDEVSFESLDKNHDGYLKRSEIPSKLSMIRTRFSSFDRDHDLKLNRAEFAMAHLDDATPNDWNHLSPDEQRARRNLDPVRSQSKMLDGRVVRQGGVDSRL